MVHSYVNMRELSSRAKELTLKMTTQCDELSHDCAKCLMVFESRSDARLIGVGKSG